VRGRDHEREQRRIVVGLIKLFNANIH